MKKLLKSFIASASILLAVSLPAVAQDWALGYGIGGATADTIGIGGRGVNNTVIGSVLSNASWFATSIAPAGSPRIQFIDVSTDMASVSTALSWYIATNSYTITNATPAAGTNVFNISSTNGLGNGDLLLLRNVSSDSYQLIVNSNSSAFTLVTYTTISNACASGDKLYKLARIGSIGLFGSAGQNSRTNFSANNLITGRESSPLVLIATGSNAVTINGVSGEYFRRSRF